MKYRPLFIVCAGLLVLGLGFLVAGFNGDMNVTFGSSLQSNVFRLCGTTTGWLAVIGMCSIFAGVLMLVVSLVALTRNKIKT